jgi:signal transduction histidine kinase
MAAGHRPLTVGLVLVLIVAAPGLAMGEVRSSRNVLTVHSGPVDYTSNATLDSAIRKSLLFQPGEPIDYFTEFLEFDRFDGVATSLALRDYIARKYRERRIDLVIAVTHRAVRFVLEHRATLFPHAAVVFAGLVDAGDRLAHGDGVTGVRFGNAYSQTLELALTLHPATREVFVVAQTPSSSSVAAVRAQLSALSRRVRLTYIEADSVADLRAAVKALPQGSLVLYIWYQLPGVDYVVHPEELARVVAESSPVPVYGAVESNLGTGLVGGVVRDSWLTGARVGALARRILEGELARDIPIEYADTVPVFDWRQLRRWGIDPSRLPKGSEIRFKVPTVWEQYRQYIIASVAVMAAQLLLIAALLVQRNRRRDAERTVQAREAALRRSYQRIRQLTGRLINAQEVTRAEIARDLHDDVCQDLVGVSVEISTLMRSSGRIQDQRAQRVLTRLQAWALALADSVRRLSHDLHPPTLQLLGLVAALKAHCVEVERRYDVRVAFSAAPHLARVDADVALCAFRIAQEALRNSAVHGKARQLSVSIDWNVGDLELIVADDGQGFDLEEARLTGGCMGLVGMEERAYILGGDVSIATGRGRGTTVRLSIPGRCPSDMPPRTATAAMMPDALDMRQQEEST